MASALGKFTAGVTFPEAYRGDLRTEWELQLGLSDPDPVVHLLKILCGYRPIICSVQATCITGRKTRDLSDIIFFVWTSHRFSMLITNTKYISIITLLLYLLVYKY